MEERILVPLDGSAAAEAALAYAELLPSRRVRLLQIEPDTEGPIFATAEEWDAWRAAREQESRAYLERVSERLRQQGRTVEIEFAFGDPADWILAFSGDANLIVMTTRGRGAGSRMLFGSVADRVARYADTPTLLVRGAAVAPESPLVTRILVPLDGSPLAERALPIAASLASDLGVPIHLIQVLDVDPVRAAVEAGLQAAHAYARTQEEVRRQAVAHLDTLAQALKGQQLVATAEVLEGNPVPTLLDTIVPGDLVVMTSHGRSGVQRWLLGSVADKLIREAAAPVLLVRGLAVASSPGIATGAANA